MLKRINPKSLRVRTVFASISVRNAAVAQIAEPLRTREDQELAFVCCVRMLEADGVIAPEEFRVLRILRRLFGFTQDEVKRLVSR